MTEPIPVPQPTPYRSPAQGGNKYVVPGVLGASISANDTPIGTNSAGNVVWNSGTVTPLSTIQKGVGGAYPQKPANVKTNTNTNTQNTSKNNNGGGGGGGDNNNNTPTPSPIDDLLREIDAAYSDAMGSASRAEAVINDNKDQIIGNIQSTGENSKAQAQSAYNQSSQQIAGESQDSNTRYMNAMAAARQALSETRIGTQQRFGRDSQIGRALGEYATVNFQKAAGQASQTYEQAATKLAQLKTNLEEGFKNSVIQINQWVGDSISKAKTDFTNQLLSIESMRQGAAENKSARRITALQNLKASIDNINLTAWQYQQNLRAQTAQQQANWNQMAEGLKAYYGSASAVGQANASDNASNAAAYTNNGLMGGGISGGVANDQPVAQTGAISYAKPKDEYGQPTYS